MESIRFNNGTFRIISTGSPVDGIGGESFASRLPIVGRPLFYATAFPHGGAALGVLAGSHLGRPTKLEGNPLHPANLGATDALAQASVLQLYDPDRSQVITRGDEILPPQALATAIANVMKRYGPPANGEGLRFLTPGVTSPTLAWQMRRILKRFPQARWHRWEPLNRDSARRGSIAAFEQIVDARYDLTKAEVILAVDADFLASGPGSVRYAREFSYSLMRILCNSVKIC